MLVEDVIIKDGRVRTKDSIMECPYCKSTFQKDHVRTRMKKWGKDKQSFYSTKHCPNCDKRILLRDDNPDIESVNTRLSKLRTYCNYCKMNGQFDEYRDAMSEILELQKQIEDMRNGEMSTKDAKNFMGERVFQTYEAWKRACRQIDPNVKFDGDIDICQAGKIGEWDGNEGIIYSTKDAKKLMKDAASVALKKLGQVKKQVKDAFKGEMGGNFNLTSAGLPSVSQEFGNGYQAARSGKRKEPGASNKWLEGYDSYFELKRRGLISDKKTKDDFPVGAKVKYVGKYADPALTNARATIVGAGNDKGVGGGNMVRIRFDNGREAIVPYMDVEHTNDSKKTKDDSLMEKYKGYEIWSTFGGVNIKDDRGKVFNIASSGDLQGAVLKAKSKIDKLQMMDKKTKDTLNPITAKSFGNMTEGQIHNHIIEEADRTNDELKFKEGDRVIANPRSDYDVCPRGTKVKVVGSNSTPWGKEYKVETPNGKRLWLGWKELSRDSVGDKTKDQDIVSSFKNQFLSSYKRDLDNAIDKGDKESIKRILDDMMAAMTTDKKMKDVYPYPWLRLGDRFNNWWKENDIRLSLYKVRPIDAVEMFAKEKRLSPEDKKMLIRYKGLDSKPTAKDKALKALDSLKRRVKDAFGMNIEEKQKEFDVRNIEKETVENNAFRKVIFTGNTLQLVLMSLLPNEDIGMEVHDNVDQFFRVEEGEGLLEIKDQGTYPLKAGSSMLVTAGTQHNVKNIGNEPLKLYTLYGPPNHPADRLQNTKAEAVEAEKVTKDEGNFLVGKRIIVNAGRFTNAPATVIEIGGQVTHGVNGVYAKMDTGEKVWIARPDFEFKDSKTKDVNPADSIKNLLQKGYSLKEAILETEKSIGRQLNAFEAAEAVAVSKKMRS